MNGERAEELLKALGEVLEAQDDEPLDIVVCGGMALILQGIVVRRTVDIDGLGIVVRDESGLRVAPPSSIDNFNNAVQRVGNLYSEQPDWFNFAATNQLEMAMPEGLIERAQVRVYGNRLTVRLCSRFDIVHLKMMASLDRGEEQTTDLIRMRPSEDEARAAASWCLEQGCSPYRLKSLLEDLGHGELAATI